MALAGFTTSQLAEMVIGIKEALGGYTEEDQA